MPLSIDYHEYRIKSLKDPTKALGYLNATLEDPDPRVFAAALKDVAIALGGTKRKKVLSLLSGRRVPDLQRVGSVLAGLGLRLSVEKKRAA
jgi:DNA-binding phage protein